MQVGAHRLRPHQGEQGAPHTNATICLLLLAVQSWSALWMSMEQQHWRARGGGQRCTLSVNQFFALHSTLLTTLAQHSTAQQKQ